MSGAGVPADSAPSSERPTGHHKYNKACDSCHVSKVRCIPEPLSPVGACKRCAKNGNPCVYTPVGPRRRPTRTKNERIAELERRVRDMQLLLRNKDEQHIAPASSESTPRTSFTEITDVVASPLSRSAPATVDGSNPSSPSIASHEASDAPDGPLPDVVDRGIITLAQSEDLIRDYRSDMEFEFLGISLPKHISAAELRRTKPLLWLSALCAASSGSLTHYDLAGRLHVEMNRIIQEGLTPDAKPNLAILQALRNFVFHHHEPTYPNQRHFLEHSRYAVRMVVAIGQASKPHMLEGTEIPDELIDQDALELSRELLIWYWSSFVITMKVRQPLMLRYNRLVRQSMRIVEKSPEHADRCLASWVKLAHLAQDATTTLFRAHTSHYGLNDEGRDVIIEEFEEKMQEWIVHVPMDIMNPQLMLEYHSYIILISEVMFPAGKLTYKDFEKRPASLPPLTKADGNPHHHYLLSPWKLSYTRKCLTAAHSMLDIFTNMTPEGLRRLGNIVYGRVFYALRYLFQLAHQIWATSTYDLIKIDSLRLQLYIDALVGSLRRASADGKFKVAAIWLYALESRVIPWYKEFCKKLDEEPRETPEPPKPSPRPSQDDYRPIPAEIMLPPIQPFCGDATTKPAPVTPNMILQIPPNGANSSAMQFDATLPAQTSPSMALFNDQFFSPTFHHGQVPLDTFDPDAFSPSDLTGLSQYGHPGQFVTEDAMDVDSYGVDFSAMYDLISNNLTNGWNGGGGPNGPQEPPR